MNTQKSRQQMFEEIQKLQRELAEGTWETVNIKHDYIACNLRLTEVLSFINGNGVEISVGMALGSDSNLSDADNVVRVLRQEIEKIIEQTSKSG